ncbi:hypothetical protein I3843_07G034300 [Carya illinoinensis]|uniref:Uncharacterized protein n=1 Tax=Carya illinoinensis TaxID=32201 RepID=A0A922EIH5_CARIL|nr:hypothetical protein I3842_07G035100 [Carya illinoinensis]KAG7969519.1 hypothetical protein I3843_07G034300 [Carya illinoinensis]
MGAKMERSVTTTVLPVLIITMLLLVFSPDQVEGGRQLKSQEKVLEQPQTFFGGVGSPLGFFTSPPGSRSTGTGGSVPGSSSGAFCYLFPGGSCVPALPSTTPSTGHGSIGVGSPPAVGSPP